MLGGGAELIHVDQIFFVLFNENIFRLGLYPWIWLTDLKTRERIWKSWPHIIKENQHFIISSKFKIFSFLNSGFV